MLRPFTLFIPALLALSTATAYAQQHWTCGHQGSLDPELVARAMAAGEQRDGVRYVKTRVVIGAIPDGNGGITQAVPFSRVQRDLDFANEAFLACGSGVQFQLCDAPDVVVNPGLYYSGVQDFDALIAQRIHGYVTVFYFGPMFPPGAASFDFASVASNAPIWVLAHELAHILGMPHTDGSYGPPIAELVDGSNCAFAGDMICDTPADPGLYQPGLVDPVTCTYIGTLTDANGDTYAPLLNNIMAAGFCVKDSFTPGQGLVMRYVLENTFQYLLHTPNPVLIEPFPTSFCTNDPPTPLQATPAPGVFSGPWVQQDALQHVPAPGGQYHVTYIPLAPTDPGLWTFADVQHAAGPYVGQQLVIPLPTDSVRQSFRSVRSGWFDRVDVRLHHSTAIDFRMRLYQGTGMALTLLHDTIATYSGPDTLWVSFAIPDNVPCTGNEVYSFVITADGATFTPMAPVGSYLAWGTNNMGPFNLAFRSWIRAAMPCQQSTRVYDVIAIPERPVLNLPAGLCDTETAEIFPVFEPSQVTASAFVLNGTPANSVDFSQLGIGTHLLEHIYTINGCTDTLPQVFTVEALPAFTFQELPSVLCLDGEAIALTAEPALGSFTINGSAATELDPQVLGVGTHEVLHTYINALDTVTYPDQICCTQHPGGFRAFLGVDSTAWQSFVPSTSGILAAVVIELELYGIPRTLIAELRSGEGLDGPLLRSDTIMASMHNGVLFAGTDLQLEAGSSYTWSIHRVADTQPILPPAVGYAPADLYPAAAHVPGVDIEADLRFILYLTKTYACSSTEAFDVAVEICTGINEQHAAAFTAWPNPFTDQVLLRGGAVPVDLMLFSADGRLVHGQRLPAGATAELGLAHLAPGAYWFRASTMDGGPLPGMPMLKVAY